MSAPEGYFAVAHGNTTVNVPRAVFKGPDADIDENELKRFRDLTMARCPWINSNSFDVLMRKARTEFIRLRDEESGGISASRRMASGGDRKGAIALLRSHLEEDPDDVDAWMELGKVLCDDGQTEEGYKAFNEARRHY